MFLFTCFISFFLWRLYKWSQIDFNFRREGRRFKILIIEIICIGVYNVIYCSALSSMSPPSLFYGHGGLVLAMGAMWVVVAAVGALVSILLVPVVGLVVVAAVLLLLLVAAGAALLLLLLAVGAALLLLLIVGHCVKSFFTSDKEAFLCIRLRMTPQQVTKYSTQQLGHHACFTCEVNGRSLTCVLYTCSCCMHIFL